LPDDDGASTRLFERAVFTKIRPPEFAALQPAPS
jgi:hypothetical protein